ncbi:unnamed protein product [Moneuplotes crassus]|uniref:Uncharacterized protein n=1 Tax=Euplotes crassus TaxID=5936 RepID=A0AAD1XP25_EUPCR|nr:unnamed protein product [Moneuplotes crassus]
MVKRESKYKTNKKIAKNKTSIDIQIQEHLCYNKVDFENTQHRADQGKTAATFKKDGNPIPEYRVYTDNSHYEVIDKKSQRKKKNNTKKAISTFDNESCSTDTSVENSLANGYKILTVEAANEMIPQGDVGTEEYKRHCKKISKKMQKQNRKIYKAKGNINHLVNYVELPDTFEFSKKELAKSIITDAGKKNTIYNASNKDEDNYEKGLDKLRNRTRKKRLINNKIKGDMGETVEFSNRRLHCEKFKI